MLMSVNVWGAVTDLSESLDLTGMTAGSNAYKTTTTYGDWKIVNGANNSKGWTYFKMGGKNSTISTYNPCYIYYSANSGVSSQVDSITVSIAAGSLSKSGMSVNSWGVYVYSDKAMTTQVDYVVGGTITKNAATFGFKPSAGKTWGKGYYYKVSWDLANSTTTNGIVCIDKITLHSITAAPDPVLQSIAISGTPKTTYEAGEEFDITGLVVTGTYDTKDPEEITEGISWEITPSGALTAGTTSVSVTATVDGKSDTKNYAVTVNEHVVTPGTYEISLNNALYGISTGNNGTEQSVTTHDITVVSGCSSNASSKTYYDTNHIRYYTDSYLKLSVPAGFEITSVVFTASGTWNGGITSTPAAYNADTKTWTGKSQNVDFAFALQNRAAKITVTFAEKKVVSSIAVKTNPTKTTYYVGDEFDPAGLVITASYASGDPEDIAYSDANKDAFSFSGFNSEAVATDQVITVTYAEKSATFNIDIQAARVLNSIEVASNPTKMVYEVGEALDLTGLVVNGIYSTGDPEAVEYTAAPADGTTLDAVGTTTVTLTSVENTELTTSFDVTVNAIEGDRLTLASTGVSSGYTAWTDKTGSEGVAKYAGQSSNGNSSIQMRNQSPSGIVSTTSGGLIKKVKVDWNTNTANGRSIKIYGSNTAYTESADVYDSEKRGEELGSIAKGTTELEITGDFAYVGILPVGGAMYLNSITFVWAAPKELVSIAVKTAPTVVNYAAGEFFNPAGLVITATYDDESAADIAYEGNEDKFSFSPALDVALATTDEQVTITYGGKSCNQTITVKNIELTSIVVSGDLSKTEYTEGDDFDFTGLVATGYYSDESHKTITDQVDWSIDPATLSAGQTSVKVIATMNEISGDKTYDITVAKAPSIVTWDLTKDETATATADEISWTSDFATMIDVKGESTTPANNYYPGDKDSHTSTRFYKNSVLTIAPVDNNVITKVEFTATSEGYASALQGSTWTNASASVSNTTLVTVTPTDGTQAFFATIGGTCGFTAVKVYYQPGATMTSIAVKTAPSKVVYNAGESFNPAGLVITATYDDASTKDITYDANDTKWEFAPGLTDKLDATDDEVIISYNEIMCEDALEITVNRIASNLAAVSATKILVVDEMPDVTEWYTIATNYDGTVAFSSDNTEVFDVEEGTGFAYAAGSATLTITASQTDTYAQASVTVAVTVNAAAVPCSVKWMNNGEEYTAGGPSTVVNAGQKVTKLPTAPAPCDAQHKFMGWTNNPIATPQAAAPGVLFTDVAGAPTVDADNTIYYAVYAIESIDEDIDSYTFTGVGTITGGVATLTTSSGNTIRMDKGEGSNNPAWNAGASEARLYAKGLMTVSSSETISKIVYSYTVNANSKGDSPTINGVAGATTAGTWDSENKTWTGSDTEVTFSTSGSAGNIGFTNVTIYTGGGYKYSDYSTTCAAVELDKIELSGTYPTTFLVGDEFSHEGMTVTASYKNSATTKVVTNLATFTDKATGEAVNMSAVGSKTILVSYTEDEITRTDEYDITINDLPNKTIQEFIAAQGVKCYLTAIVSNLDGNQYDLTDNSGTIHGYKYTLATGVSALANGDRIRVKAEEYEYYQGKTHEVKNIVVLEKLAFSAIAVSGTMSVTEYTEGNTLNSDGLVVKGKYADEDEAMHEITEGITWNMPTAVLGTSEYDVTATVGTLTSPAYHVTGITVNAAKVLTGITIVTEPKKTFWVGENFSTDGIQVTASYDGAEDADVTALCSFSRAETQITDAIVDETITVSYTEGTETKTATYTINANWMTLADLVENVIPTEAAVKVWVKITDALVKVRNNSYLTTDVTYGDSQTKEVKIYKSGVDATWVAGGTISGELKDVDWKLYGSDWELMPSDWTWATYTPAAPTPVTGVSLSESTLKIKVGKTATLTATVTPDNATDKSVTWTIINDNANGKITVDQTGLVTVAADAVEGATATVQVTTTEGGFTATCTVTVTVPVVTKYYLVTDASTLHVGDIIVLGATKGDNSYINGDLSGDYLTSVEATITDDVLSTADAFEFVLGGEEGAWTLTSVNDALGATAAKKLTYDDTKTGFVGTWTINIDENNNATIAPNAEDYGKFLYNVNSPRFLTYTSDPTATMLLPQIYHRYKETVRENVTEGTIGTMVYKHNITAIAGAVIYEPNYVEGNELEFIEVLPENTVAGLPYIFVANGENDGKVQINFGTDDPAIDCDHTNRGLVGNMGLEAIYVSDPSYAIYQNQIRPANNTKVAVGRAYIENITVLYELEPIVTAAPRRRFSLGIERSMPTGFETIMMQKGMNKVIMNNQLFLIRDGKLFNAQGALVK